MPPLPHDEDDASDADVPTNDVIPHIESNVEADVHAKDQLKDELMEDIEAKKGKRIAKEEKMRVSPTASNEDEAEHENGEASSEDDDDEDEEAYEVERIVDHEWRRKKGKGQKLVLLYNVKWKGYPDSENTLEPEENLIASRDLLAKYHHKIGGAPQPPPPSETKKKRSTKSLTNDQTVSTAEESPPPAAKRQKRTKSEEQQTSDPDLEADEAKFGSWVPKGTNWESDVQAIETVERDQMTKDLYILLLFKNGKKSRVKNAVMRKKAPQRLLDFYEAHLSV